MPAPTNNHRAGKSHCQPTHEPTEDEIAAQCALIREGWSEYETEKRIVYGGYTPVQYEPVRSRGKSESYLANR